MAHLDKPPVKTRVARPRREAPEPKKSRRSMLIIGGILVACALLACLGSYGLYNLINGINASSGAATTANSFLNALATQNYAQAYQSLGPAITLSQQKDQFAEQAQTADRCYGNVTNYVQIADSASTQGTSQSYSYTMTRTKLTKTYTLRLTLQQDQYDPNNWKVTNYGNNLGPDSGAPACKA